MKQSSLGDAEYERLLAFRDGLRAFLKWSAQRASESGLRPAHHQLLLVVRGCPGARPTVGDIADHLILRHHSAGELVARCEREGLVERVPDARDHRIVRVHLTPEGADRLTALSELHLEELARLGPQMELWAGLPEP